MQLINITGHVQVPLCLQMWHKGRVVKLQQTLMIQGRISNQMLKLLFIKYVADLNQKSKNVPVL